MQRPLTVFEHALVGCLLDEPASAYALMQRFATTPLAHFGSGSPGAIYPALHRLRRAKVVEAVSARGAGRGKTLRATASGRAAVLRWAAQPITADDLVRHDEELMLRFAFLEHAPAAATERFLTAYAKAAREQARAVAAWARAHGRTLAFHGRFALRYGVADYRTKARWAEQALAALPTGSRR